MPIEVSRIPTPGTHSQRIKNRTAIPSFTEIGGNHACHHGFTKTSGPSDADIFLVLISEIGFDERNQFVKHCGFINKIGGFGFVFVEKGSFFAV